MDFGISLAPYFQGCFYADPVKQLSQNNMFLKEEYSTPNYFFLKIRINGNNSLFYYLLILTILLW